jgi:hypothetical protein
MLTVRSLEDIGYSVNSAAADPFFLSLALRAAGSPPLGRVELLNDIMSGPIFRR